MGKKVFNLSFYLLIFAVAYYILVFSLESVLTHMIIGDNVHDVGVYDQIIWLFSRFMMPYSTCGGQNLFGFHVSFYCALFAPLFWLWNDIRALYIIQTLLLGLAVFPIYFYAKEKLGSSYLALIIGISFLLYPILGNMNLDNFHPEVAIVFFFSLAIYYLLRNNFRLFYVFFAFSLMGKEDMAVIFVFVGLYILLFKKKLKPALLVILISIGYYLLCSKIIMPIANGIIPFVSSGPVFYSHWFGLYAENIINPQYYLASIFRPEAWQYYRRILEPLGYLPLISPSILLMGLPQVLVNVLSNIGYLISINYHYDYVVVVVVFFALIQGLSVFNKLKIIKNIAFIIIGLTLLVLAFFYNDQWSRLPFRAQWPRIVNKISQAKSAEVKAILEGLKLIPKNASVSASSRLFPQLDHRKEIYFFPNPFQEAYRKPGEWLPSAKEHLDYVAVLWWNLGEEEKLVFNYLQKSPLFETIYRKGDIIILKNNKKSLPSDFGVKYELYDFNTHSSFLGKPANQSQLKQAGVVSMLYFPESDYYFANLLGEKLTVGSKFVVDFSGYLFIPKENNYSFILQGQGEVFLEIDGNNVNRPIKLKPGFHPFRVKYLSSGHGFGLKISIKPEGEKEYIPSDRDFVFKASNLDQIAKERLQEIREKEKLIKSLPNLVVNGDFELVGANHQPVQWELETWRSADALCSYEVDTRVKKSGQKSARLEHGGSGTGVSSWKQTIQVKPDTRYKLAGWIKTENVTPKGAGAWIFLGGLSVGTKRVYGTSDWQYYEIEVRTGIEQDKVDVLCRLGDYGWDNQGVAFFDEVVFRELPDEDLIKYIIIRQLIRLSRSGSSNQ